MTALSLCAPVADVSPEAVPVLWSHLSNFFHSAFQHNGPHLCLLGCPLRPLLGLDVPQRSHPEKMIDSLCDTFANYPQTSIHSLAGIYVCKNFKVLRSETNLGVTKNVKQKIWDQIALCLCTLLPAFSRCVTLDKLLNCSTEISPCIRQ